MLDKANHERFSGLGVDPAGGDPAEFQQLLVREAEKWRKVTTAAAIVPR